MAKNQKKSFLLYESQKSLITLLGEAERAALLTAIYDYAVTGEYRALPTAASEVAFAAIRMQLDMDAERYDEICTVRRASASIRWEKEKKGEKDEKPLPSTPKKKKAAPKAKPKVNAKNANACKCTYDEDEDEDDDVDGDGDDDERRARSSGSFETDAFFEAALRRSYGEKGVPNAKKTP